MSAFINDGAPVRTAKKASDPAFPNGAGDHGLTIRDWFAGQALMSLPHLCAADTLLEGRTFEQHIARNAYKLADAMLAERSKQ